MNIKKIKNKSTKIKLILALLTVVIASFIIIATVVKDSTTAVLIQVPSSFDRTEQDSGGQPPQDYTVLALGSPQESAYVPPENALDWMMLRKPPTLHQGQISHCKINGTEWVVSVPHVVTTPDWPHKLPTNQWIGDWIMSADGREVAFAPLYDRTKFGFKRESVEAAEPKPAPAVLKASILVNGMSLPLLSISGYLTAPLNEGELEILTQKMVEFGSTSQMAFRLSTRARGKSVLLMPVSPEVWERLPGCSGGLVWQDDKPVGVFIGRFPTIDSPVLVIEPLLESARATLPASQ